MTNGIEDEIPINDIVKYSALTMLSPISGTSVRSDSSIITKQNVMYKAEKMLIDDMYLRDPTFLGRHKGIMSKISIIIPHIVCPLNCSLPNISGASESSTNASNNGAIVFANTVNEVTPQSKVKMFQIPTTLAAFFPQQYSANSSYFSLPIFSAHSTRSIPQKYEITAPNMISTIARMIPSLAQR